MTDSQPTFMAPTLGYRQVACQGRPRRAARRSLLVIVLTAFVCFAWPAARAAARAADCAAGGLETVCTDSGVISGVYEGDMQAFKGIRYARAPVGDLRWRAPLPPEPWAGVRAAKDFGPVCPQLAGKTFVGAEDCLTLNIWRPRHPPANPMPVMVWLTGGGNHSLSGQGSPSFGGVSYNGASLVPRGVVFVSFNIRLGALGFLAHPALDAENEGHVSGNYGNLDQIAMLGWLRRNVAAFGGDPDRVFLFGTSAGGGNICALLTAPLARGLFQMAAMESSVPSGCELPTLQHAEASTGAALARAIGCEATANVAVCLRQKSAADLVAALPGSFGVLPRVYGPNVDGVVFPDQPIKRIASGQFTQMPVIIGNTAAETSQWADSAGSVTDPASMAVALDRVFGAGRSAPILAVYALRDFRTPGDAFVRITTDALFTCPSLRVARTIAAAQIWPVYRYRFSQTLQNDPDLQLLGPTHTIEHAFLFGWRGRYRPTAIDLAVQERMIGYWTRMAISGNPNGAPDPAWPIQTKTDDSYLEIGSETVAATGPADARCAFWDSILLPSPHM